MGSLAFAAGCSSSNSDSSIAQPYGAPPDPRPPTSLRWQLTATPTTLTMSQRGTFRLSISVENISAAPLDPRRGELVFLVNGKPSPVCDLAFGNGGMEAKWTALPAGASASDARDLGLSLFESPGKYDIELRHQGSTVGRVGVEVTADGATIAK